MVENSICFKRNFVSTITQEMSLRPCNIRPRQHQNHCAVVHFHELSIISEGRPFSRPYGVTSVVVVCLSVTLCIVAKRCVLEQKFLLTAYRKSYIRNRLVPNEWPWHLFRGRSRSCQQLRYLSISPKLRELDFKFGKRIGLRSVLRPLQHSIGYMVIW